jgi:hypothetical protein
MPRPHVPEFASKRRPGILPYVGVKAQLVVPAVDGLLGHSEGAGR